MRVGEREERVRVGEREERVRDREREGRARVGEREGYPYIHVIGIIYTVAVRNIQ